MFSVLAVSAGRGAHHPHGRVLSITLSPHTSFASALHSCVKPIYTASSFPVLAVIFTTLCLSKRHKRSPQLPESVTFTSINQLPGRFKLNYINFLFPSCSFFVCVCLFLMLWPLRAHRWHRVSRSNAMHSVCALGGLSASNSFSLISPVIPDGFKYQGTENEPWRAVCPHWLHAQRDAGNC